MSLGIKSMKYKIKATYDRYTIIFRLDNLVSKDIGTALIEGQRKAMKVFNECRITSLTGMKLEVEELTY